MTTLQQLITLAVTELGLTAEDPSTDLNTPDCRLLLGLAERVLNTVYTTKLYKRRKVVVNLNQFSYDLSLIPHRILEVERVTVKGSERIFLLDGDVLTVDTLTPNVQVTIEYISAYRVPNNVTYDLNLPQSVTPDIIVAGICLEYSKVKGLEYAINYYQEAFERGLDNALRTKKRVYLKPRRFV